MNGSVRTEKRGEREENRRRVGGARGISVRTRNNGRDSGGRSIYDYTYTYFVQRRKLPANLHDDHDDATETPTVTAIDEILIKRQRRPIETTHIPITSRGPPKRLPTGRGNEN
ncbi:unnamed protein product [Soboliphyme baturini]|uniref:Uncharacterized protein n=1 Tax=Soboliphyme baturini TaxID=241478 RepID=A0A183J724_9BILA|nr:unnamed protein product [Soboliphyme baturini]